MVFLMANFLRNLDITVVQIARKPCSHYLSPYSRPRSFTFLMNYKESTTVSFVWLLETQARGGIDIHVSCSLNSLKGDIWGIIGGLL